MQAPVPSAQSDSDLTGASGRCCGALLRPGVLIPGGAASQWSVCGRFSVLLSTSALGMCVPGHDAVLSGTIRHHVSGDVLIGQ